jgi:carboxymethylenebutenolidase
MCFDTDSSPPIQAVTGASTREHRLTLTGDDGNEFLAFEAFADHPGNTAVVILPDVRGLYRFYEELAVRLAEAGHDAIAIDYFGRTAGLTARDDDFPYQEHVPLVTHTGLRSDVAAAVARVRETNPARRVFTVGFCFGGSNSWQQAANGHGLAGAIGFYGRPDGVRPVGARPPLEVVDEMTCPVLALMGGDDPGIPPEVVARFDQALTRAGVPHEVVVYPGAPHSFFDRKYAEFSTESADAWQRVLAFVAQPGGG